MPKNNISVDVIIPIYKPDKRLGELIKRILSGSIAINQIILIHTLDNDDSTYKYKDERVVVLPVKKEEFNHGKTRDTAVRYSKADIVVLMTQDALPKNSKLIEELISPLFKDSSIVISYARQTVGTGHGKRDVIEEKTREFNYPDKSFVKSSEDIDNLGIKTFFVSNACAAYDRNTYIKLCGFDEEIFGEDMMYAVKAINSGYRIAYVAEAIVIHSHSYSMKEQFKRNFDIGVLHKQHSDVFKGIKSESEGIKMVLSTAKALIVEGKIIEIFRLIAASGAKFLGYRFGKLYDILPKKILLNLTLNKGYWKS